ncbi:MAG: translation elongation factor-like protein [Anaerolineae bacterium]
MAEKEIGRVSHYFRKIGVAGIELTAPLRVGDTIRIRGFTTDFEQTVESMELDHQAIEQAKSGQSIGVKVIQRARRNDRVYKVE